MAKVQQKRIKEVREELSQMIPLYLEEAIIKSNFKKMDQEMMSKLGEEFAIPISDDFFYTFIPKLLEYLIKVQQQQRLINNITFPPLTLIDLINISFFPSDLPVLKRYPILEKLVENLNYRIHKFFINKRPLFQSLINEQKKMDQQQNDSFEQKLIKEIDQLKREKVIEKSQIKESELKIEVDPNFLSSEDLDLLKLANYSEPSDNQLQCEKCFCHQKKQIVYSPIIRCLLCQYLFHTKCLQLNTPKQIFICPFCIIAENDLLNEAVEEIISPFVFRKGSGIPSCDLKFDLKKNEQPTFTNKFGYELRCIKIDGGNEEIQWPAYGRLQVNGEQILQFYPLPENSSLKRRKDEAVQLNLRKEDFNIITLSEEQYIKNKNYRATVGLDYVVALYKIKMFKPTELIEKIKAQQQNYMSIDQSKIMIKVHSMYHLEEGVEMEKIKVSLIDVYDCGLIKTPVRGSLCIHVQCFSLENICQLMSRIKSNIWRCPICKSIILNFKIDTYQLAILNIIRSNNLLDITEITFNTKGEIETPKLKEELCNYDIKSQYMNQDMKQRQLYLEILSQKTLKLPYVFQDTSITAIKKVKKKFKEIKLNIKSIKGTAKEPICID